MDLKCNQSYDPIQTCLVHKNKVTTLKICVAEPYGIINVNTFYLTYLKQKKISVSNISLIDTSWWEVGYK